MSGPAGVMALVLAESAAGGVALLFLMPLWEEVRRGFFKLAGVVLLALSLGAWRSIAAGLTEGEDGGRWAVRLALVFFLVTLAWVALLFAGASLPGRVLGIGSVALAVAMLAALAGAAEGSRLVGFVQLAAGALFLGAVVDGLLLGHWYLTDRGLTRAPINRFALALLVAVAAEAAAVASGGFGATEPSSHFNPLLTSAGGLAAWIALGMVGTTGLIAVLIRLTLKGQQASAVQAATGFFYLAVITAFTADLAARVRFLPAS